MLSKKQKEVAEAIFEGELTEKEIREKFKLSPLVWSRWLGSEEFQEELGRWSESSSREAGFIISRYGPIAALKLVELLNSDKPDVARRAALDLVDRCMNRGGVAAEDRVEDEGSEPTITDEQARKMILALAEGVE